MIERDYNAVHQSVWGQLCCCSKLQWLTLEQATHVVEFTAQLIRWREQEIHERLNPAVGAPIGLLCCAFEDCDQDRASGSELCQSHIDENAAEDARQAARRLECESPPPLKHIAKDNGDCVSYCEACRVMDPQTGLQPGEVPAPDPTADCPPGERCSEYPTCACGPF